jgi:hypothetical protein
MKHEGAVTQEKQSLASQLLSHTISGTLEGSMAVEERRSELRKQKRAIKYRQK